MTCIDSECCAEKVNIELDFLVACIPTRLLTGKFNNSCQKNGAHPFGAKNDFFFFFFSHAGRKSAF